MMVAIEDGKQVASTGNEEKFLSNQLAPTSNGQ